MITNESAMDRISVVSRMLAYQQDQGESMVSALAKTKSSLPAHYDDSIEAIKNIITGDEDVVFTGYGAGPFRIFAVLAGLIRKEDGDVSQLFIGAKEYIQEAVIQAREYWSGFNSLIAYLVVVFILAITVIAIFTKKVMPGFEEVFSNFGAELPTLTKFILVNESMFMLVTGILTLCVLICVASSYHVRKQVAQLRPLSSICRWIPGVRSLDDIYSYFLFVHFANVLTNARVEGVASFNHAKDLSMLTDKKTSKFSVWWDAVKAAQEVGVLDQEIEYQVSHINTLFSRQMILLRESVTLITQISLGLLIGLFVIAMYLPIFMLGSAI
ncbi:hypothetical protein [Pseudoteredinibacter isoporae]|uniref:Type II secretory pathway component PulF n=1 Tax=Pseudoteredinibacter isoporae TaxID=570281 RepID=A0A7X0JTG5_9GAMM|nr:hypothetical protein [Pseudoteredinibacter isoporae]MBB6521919.1 type II secretory pathway component PulF [Pseudoteredinibacter isoporae]NHO87459.1 hypothetical protein [Pseudoteredinibacter isoporae]NIB24210.1 hypothetical protein [Pseudoteredinibacter isoporae]